MILLKNSSFALALGLLLTVTVANHASAQTTSLESQLLSCANATSNTTRLKCYDELADRLRSTSAATERSGTPSSSTVASASKTADSTRPDVDPVTGVPVSGSNEQPAARTGETFDVEEKKKQSIRVMIEKTKRNARGDWYFYFDNGEVWKQIDTRNRRIPPLPIAATISRGIFSSHKLHVDGQVWAMKIRRVK